MLLITCPVTRTDELVADRRVRSVANHPTHVALTVECPACGSAHVYRTGRRWEAARRRVAEADARADAGARAAALVDAGTRADAGARAAARADAGAGAATAVSARAAQELSRA